MIFRRLMEIKEEQLRLERDRINWQMKVCVQLSEILKELKGKHFNNGEGGKRKNGKTM